MTNDEFEFDVALSFAGEDRAIAKEFTNLLMNKNVKVFYDEDEADDLWGKDLIAHLADLYQNKARFCVMFISRHYPLKRWTNFERQQIQARAFRDTNEYILPIRIDDTDVPGIAETMGYRDIRQHPLESIANSLEKKLAKVKGQTTISSPAQVARPDRQESSHPSFGAIPMPKRNKTHTQFEKDSFARESLDFIKRYFQQALRQLEGSDSNIQTAFDDMTTLDFMSRIYVQGDVRTQCRIWLGSNFMSNGICYSEGVHRLDTNSINEVLSVEDNGEELRLKLGLFGISGVDISEKMATQQQAAEYLWKRFISPLEHR
jgi:hypothetical protein